MRRLYWQPRRVSRIELSLIGILSLGGLVVVQSFPVEEPQPYHHEKLAAARLAQRAMEELRFERQRRHIPVDAETDPTESGLIGDVISPVTSGTGSLPSKQTSINPNFAAVVVHWLMRLDLQKGDIVAVGASGSFPALNVAVFAALQTLELKPIVIASTAASQWGANNPTFTWLDMEKVLFDRGIFNIRSIAASRGGVGDRGLGLSKAGRQALDEAMDRNSVVSIKPKDDVDGVQQRMGIFLDKAEGTPIKAYVNIGGGTVSVGTKLGKRSFKPGINQEMPRVAGLLPSVMGEFVKQGVPVIHLVGIEDIAQKFGLPLAPTTTPQVGQGSIFVRRQPNRWLAFAFLVVVMGAMVTSFRGPFWVGLRSRAIR